MRKLLYAIAAGLILAPMAVAAQPAVGAAATDNCNPDGLGVDPYNDVGQWHVSTSVDNEAPGSSGEVLDSYSKNTNFCLVTVNSSADEYAFREQDTSLCATWDESAAPVNSVQLFACDPGTASGDTKAQVWVTDPSSQTGTEIWNWYADTLSAYSGTDACLDNTTGGDTAVYLDPCSADLSSQFWGIDGTG